MRKSMKYFEKGVIRCSIRWILGVMGRLGCIFFLREFGREFIYWLLELEGLLRGKK